MRIPVNVLGDVRLTLAMLASGDFVDVLHAYTSAGGQAQDLTLQQGDKVEFRGDCNSGWSWVQPRSVGGAAREQRHNKNLRGSLLAQTDAVPVDSGP